MENLAYILLSSKHHNKHYLCLQGRPSYSLISIQKKLIPVLLANYAVWPIAHLINFKFIPSSQRILYINFCQVDLCKLPEPSHEAMN